MLFQLQRLQRRMRREVGNEWRVGEDLEGGGYYLFQGIIAAFFWSY